MKTRLIAFLTMILTYTAAASVLVSADDTGYEVVQQRYFNDFTESSGYSFSRQNVQSTIENTDGRIKIELKEELGPRNGKSTFDMSIPNVDTSEGEIWIEFKVRFEDFAACLNLDRFGTVKGQLLDGTTKNIEGLYRYSGKLIAPQDWTNLGSKPYVNLSDMWGEDYATYRIIVNKPEGWWSHEIYDAEGNLKSTTGKQTSTNLPDKITGVNWNFYVGDFKTGDNTKVYFDDLKVSVLLKNSVESHTPADNEENVLLDSSPVITFKYPISEEDITKENIMVFEDDKPMSEDSYNVVLADPYNVRIDFIDNLKEGSCYTVTASNIKINGNEITAMPDSYSFKFWAIKYLEISEPSFSFEGNEKVKVTTTITANDVTLNDAYVVIAQIMKKAENGRMYVYDNAVLRGNFANVNNTIPFEVQMDKKENTYVKIMFWTGFLNGKSYVKGMETPIPAE